MSHKEIHEQANDKLIVGWNYDADKAAALQLSAIYRLLEERLPEKPMTTLVPAARPGVEDDSVRQGADGLITFTCDVKPTDSISIDSNYVKAFNHRLFIDFDVENEDEKSIGLSVEDAREFARAILREVGEG